MSKMRETVVSTCEKKFTLRSLSEFNRLDGRSFKEFRKLRIEFGNDWGCCYVSLGETRVLAQVSCEIQQPKSSRPSEGLLNINIELNPLGAPNFEAGRQSDLSVQLNRLLEKCLKDSKAVDLESLCIKVNEKVWALRVDVNVLNHEGNILDTASIAALAALAHFRRPDTTYDGEEILVHSYFQRDPIPTVIHHYPVCVSFAVFEDGDIVLADPTLLEEGVAEANLTIALNAYKELCGLHLGGSALMNADLILKTTSEAANRASSVIQEIKRHIEEDCNKRLGRNEIGFQCTLFTVSDDKNVQESLSLCLDRWTTMRKKKKNVKKEIKLQTGDTEDIVGCVQSLGQGSAALIPHETENKWMVSSDDENEPCEYSEEATSKSTKPDELVEVSSGSEEENVVVLHAESQMNKKRKKKQT